MTKIDGPEILFHYTRLTTALEQILFKTRLKLGPVSLTNDPREATSWKFTVHLRDRSPTEIFTLEELYHIGRSTSDQIIKQGVKILCFTQNTEEYPGWGRPRMWAQYGDHHRGVCLVFNKNKLRVMIASGLCGANVHIFHDSVRYCGLQFDRDIHRAFDLDLIRLNSKNSMFIYAITSCNSATSSF